MVNVGNYNKKYQSYLCYLEHGSWPVNFNTTHTRAHRSHSMHGRIWDWPCLWQNDIISRNQRMWIPTDLKMSQNYMSCARHCVQYCELASLGLFWLCSSYTMSAETHTITCLDRITRACAHIVICWPHYSLRRIPMSPHHYRSTRVYFIRCNDESSRFLVFVFTLFSQQTT